VQPAQLSNDYGQDIFKIMKQSQFALCTVNWLKPSVEFFLRSLEVKCFGKFMFAGWLKVEF